MLVILFGPSCIGKTSIQRGLMEWSAETTFVRCFQTRPPRAGDIGRVYVDHEEYQKLLDNDEIAISNMNFGHYYGTSKNDLIQSGNSRKIYTLDFLIKDRDSLDPYNHKRILIVPDSLDQVLFQMKETGRENREPMIINDFQTHYSPKNLNRLENEGFFLLKNHFNQLDKAVTDLAEYLSHRL